MFKNVKEEFDDKINKKEILQITFKEYLQDMKKFKIRYIVIFDYRQLLEYIYNLKLNKIVDVRKCIIRHQINNKNFNFRFIIPMIKNVEKYSIEFINTNNYFNNDQEEKENFLIFMKRMVDIFKDG
jgi:hypothetical protein